MWLFLQAFALPEDDFPTSVTCWSRQHPNGRVLQVVTTIKTPYNRIMSAFHRFQGVLTWEELQGVSKAALAVEEEAGILFGGGRLFMSVVP